MPRRTRSDDDTYADLGHGTYEVPGVGLVINGKLLDSDNQDEIDKFHNRDQAGREQSVEAMAARDAEIVEAVTSPADTATEE